MSSKRSIWPIRLAILGISLTGFAALTASSAPRTPALEEAQTKAGAIVKEASAIKARPIANICCSPPDKRVPWLVLRSARLGNIA